MKLVSISTIHEIISILLKTKPTTLWWPHSLPQFSIRLSLSFVIDPGNLFSYRNNICWWALPLCTMAMGGHGCINSQLLHTDQTVASNSPSHKACFFSLQKILFTFSKYRKRWTWELILRVLEEQSWDSDPGITKLLLTMPMTFAEYKLWFI